jgi:hypothetical protein
MDLIVRTPKNLKWRLEEETHSCGKSWRKVSSAMKKLTREWVRKAEVDYVIAQQSSRNLTPLHDWC